MIAEVAQASAGKSTIVLDAGMIALIVSNIGAWIALFKRVGQKPKEPTTPVTATSAENNPWPAIRAHDGVLKQHETEIKNIVKGMDDWRKENREDHTKIFDLLRADKE